MKVWKAIGRIALFLLAVSAVPYRVQTDDKTGVFEIRSLLWALRKTPRKEGEENDHYAFAIPPSGLDGDYGPIEENGREAL